MKHSQLQTDNQFDTLRLHIPENVITAPKWENFQYIQTYNTYTDTYIWWPSQGCVMKSGLFAR